MKTLSDYHLPTKISREYEIGEPMWVADLNTSERVYRDQIDGMDDSWKRLKQYLNENPHQYITGLYFRFRDNWIEITRDKTAIFFTNHVSCWYGAAPIHGFTGGYLHDNGEVYIVKYNIPELIKQSDEYRSIDDPTIQDGLIWRCGNKLTLK